jgi:outer membrane protein OmpA-like peptidoglycan-associated protein
MNTSARNGCYLLLVLLISAPGCGGDSKKVKTQKIAKKDTAVFSEINIPVAGDNVKSFFDEDLEEFVLIDQENSTADKKIAQESKNSAIPHEPALDDFSWVEEANTNEFKTVYFEFDRYELKQDQTTAVERDVELVKKLIAQGETPTIVIEGHACHSAGSRTYNLALSEKRAQVLADKLVEAGVARENIKIVARGSEVPVRDQKGKTISGDKEQQWPNRRDEIHVIYS